MYIKVEELTKSYDEQVVVDNVSFEVKQGEILGFLGPNGAGKSTTMKIITNFVSPDAGQVIVNDKNVTHQSDIGSNIIGYLPENNPLYLDMPIIDFLIFCAEIQNIQVSEIKNRVKQMIFRTGLEKEKHKKISELSKGYRQRVGLAQALIHDPKILILDEPTTGLDPNQIVEIRNLIRELGEHKTVVLSTHILPEVEATCDRILIINKGKIVADGTSASLRSQGEGNEVVNYAFENAKIDEIRQSISELKGVSEVKIKDMEALKVEVHSSLGKDTRREVFKMSVDKGWALLEMIPEETKLEDIFRKLTLN